MFGVRIIQDPNCLEDSEERLFPYSRHRSARVLKKLIKRHGGEYRKKPAMYRLGDGMIICHPSLYRQIEKMTFNAGSQTVEELRRNRNSGSLYL